MLKISFAASVIASTLVGSSALAAISFPAAGTVYTENFNIGTGAAYVPITTVAGLSAYVSGGGTGTNEEPEASANYVNYANAQMLTVIRRNTAIGAAQAVSITSQRLSFYSANQNSASGGYTAAALTFVNDTGAPISQFQLTYDAFTGTTNNSTAPADEIAFSYAFNAPDLADGSASWTYVENLSFYGYRDPVTPAQSALSQTNPAGTVTGINWLPGETLTLRWKDTNLPSPSTDRSLGVDNVIFQVPEPATLASLGLAATWLRRRRNA